MPPPRNVRLFPVQRRAWLMAMALALYPVMLEAQMRCSRQPLSTHVAHYCVTGEGSPTIVLAAGSGSTSRTWEDLLPELVSIGTVVTFDRAGLGESSASATPRTPRQMAVELGELLNLTGLPKPYVLVGHSAGGWHVLRFVERFPEQVAGVVLVDTPPVQFESRRYALLSPEEREERLQALAEGARGSSDVVRRERREGRSDVESGFLSLPADMPLIVVAANDQNFGSLTKEQAHRDLWVSLSEEWLTLSSASRLVVARGSGHMIHQEQPELLGELIRSLALRAGPT